MPSVLVVKFCRGHDDTRILGFQLFLNIFLEERKKRKKKKRRHKCIKCMKSHFLNLVFLFTFSITIDCAIYVCQVGHLVFMVNTLANLVTFF